MKKILSLIFISLIGSSSIDAQYANPASVNLSAGIANYYALAYSQISCTGSVGSTVINGNIGVSSSSAMVGLCTLSPGCPGFVNGNIDTANASSVQGQSELTLIYNAIASRTSDITYPLTTDIGGLTLTHGIYTFTQDCNIQSGNLTLDGAGNSNSVFIFRIAQAFTVGNNININLINGAQVANVFWQVGDSNVTIGMNANMKGIIIANGAITLQSNARLEGRAFSRMSSVSFDANGVNASPTKCTPPLVNLGTDVVLCVGVSITLDAGNTGANYLWSTGDSTQSIILSVSDTVYVDVTDSGTCTGSDTIVVTFHPFPIVNFGADTGRCDDYILLDAGNPGSNYLWNTGDTTQIISVSYSGNYIVIVSDSFGCTGTDTIFATIYTKPLVNLGSDIEQCAGTVMLDAGNPYLAYLWNTGDTTQTVAALSGTFNVSVTNPFGCVGHDTIMVRIDSVPSEAQEIVGNIDACPNSTGNVYSTSPVAGATSYLWSIPNDWKIVSGQGTVSITVNTSNSSGAISLTATNGTCSSSAIEKRINVLSNDGEVKIPTMYSPNGDGFNDTWVIQHIEKYPDNELFIYNRWGNEIYAKKGYQNEWGGIEQNEGTYYYILKFNIHECNEEQKSYTGYITIMR